MSVCHWRIFSYVCSKQWKITSIHIHKFHEGRGQHCHHLFFHVLRQRQLLLISLILLHPILVVALLDLRIYRMAPNCLNRNLYNFRKYMIPTKLCLWNFSLVMLWISVYGHYNYIYISLPLIWWVCANTWSHVPGSAMIVTTFTFAACCNGKGNRSWL